MPTSGDSPLVHLAGTKDLRDVAVALATMSDAELRQLVDDAGETAGVGEHLGPTADDAMADDSLLCHFVRVDIVRNLARDRLQFHTTQWDPPVQEFGWRRHWLGDRFGYRIPCGLCPRV